MTKGLRGFFRKTFRSDDVGELRALTARWTVPSKSPEKLIAIPDAIPAVVDTSQVVHDILWLVQQRKQPGARTDLAEVLDSRLLAGHAPEQLRAEISTVIPRLAKDKKIPENALWQAWEEIERRLVFHDVSTRKHSARRDPSDIPFIKLARTLGTGILTYDLDMGAMGARLIPSSSLRKLRDYGRAKAAAAGFLLMAMLWAFMIFTILATLAKPIIWLCRKLGPLGILILIAVCALVLFVFDDLREYLKVQAKRLGNLFYSSWDTAAPHLQAAAEEYAREESVARSLWKEIAIEFGVAGSSSKLVPPDK